MSQRPKREKSVTSIEIHEKVDEGLSTFFTSTKKIFLFLLTFQIIYVQLSVIKLHLVRDWGLVAVPVAPCVQLFVIKWPVAPRTQL